MQKVSLSEFYRVFLYAVRMEMEAEAQFPADGARFHQAFKSALDTLSQHGPTQLPINEILRDFDPFFGVYRGASEMLLEGERDLILSLLNPSLTRAQFKIDQPTAQKGLSLVANPEVLRAAAQVFVRQLREA